MYFSLISKSTTLNFLEHSTWTITPLACWHVCWWVCPSVTISCHVQCCAQFVRQYIQYSLIFPINMIHGRWRINFVWLLKLLKMIHRVSQTSYNPITYRVFIKYCVFRMFKIFQTLAFPCFPSVLVCVHTPGRQNTSAAAQYLMNILYYNL